MSQVEFIKDQVLSYEKLASRLKERPEDKLRAISYLEEIAADYQLGTIEKLRSVLSFTLLKLYDSIEFHTPQGIDLLHLVRNNSVILIPNHQSHADYLLLSYVLYERYRFIPLIAGGINLNIFPIGDIFRKSGCFFIRRTFNNNIIYKLTLEAYISYLLKEGHPIEFFYEGGRSRSGRLRPPKYGMFQIIMETHGNLDQAHTRPLLFIPVSIVHEIVPEQRSLTKELEGHSKKKESFSQLLKLYSFLFKRLGTVHISIGTPVNYTELMNENAHFSALPIRARTQKIAHKCCNLVGKGMVVTPSSLLLLILLNEPTGLLTLQNVLERAKPILLYCERFGIPLAPSLELKNIESAFKNVLSIFIQNRKINEIENLKLKENFYSIVENERIELLYQKNAILHHFLVPFFINSAWVNIFNGSIKSGDELKNFLQNRLEQLKDEFLLPTLNELYLLSMEIILDCTGRKLRKIEDCLSLTAKEMYSIALKVAPFSNAFRHIYEGYYLVAITLRFLKGQTFDMEHFLHVSKELFVLEMKHGRFVKYSESYTIPTIKNALWYFIEKGIVQHTSLKESTNSEGAHESEEISFKDQNSKKQKSTLYFIPSQKPVDEEIMQYAKELTETLILNLRVPLE